MLFGKCPGVNTYTHTHVHTHTAKEPKLPSKETEYAGEGKGLNWVPGGLASHPRSTIRIGGGRGGKTSHLCGPEFPHLSVEKVD